MAVAMIVIAMNMRTHVGGGVCCNVWLIPYHTRGAHFCWTNNMYGVLSTMQPVQGTLAYWYSAILSRTFRFLRATVGIELSRVVSLLIVTFVALLPLCLLNNIHVLAPFSVLGTLGVLCTAICMICRCDASMVDIKSEDSVAMIYHPTIGRTVVLEASRGRERFSLEFA